MKITLASIVEGRGEMNAVPVLLGRIARELDETVPLSVLHPIRVDSTSFLHKKNTLEETVELAADQIRASRGRVGGIVIVYDFEDGCPAQAGPHYFERIRQAAGDVPCVFTLAYRENETWFIHAAVSLRGYGGLPMDLLPDPEPEKHRDAKGWFSERMPRPYAPTLDQEPMTRRFSFSEAAAGDSFARFHRDLSAMLRALIERWLELPGSAP